MTSISLLLVDDHAVVREGFIAVARQQWHEVGAIWEARSIAEGLRMFSANRPDIVVLDLDFKTEGKPGDDEPLRDGIDAIAKFKHIDPNVCIIILTQFKGYSIERARQAGASGYLLKDWHYGQILGHIQDIFHGEPFFPSYSKLLTNREYQVLWYIFQGLSDKQIAIELGVAFVTVRDFVTHILEKFGVQSRQEAIARARELNILP